MSTDTIVQIHLVLGYVAWRLCFGVYVAPKLQAMDRVEAHRAIATLHSFRFFGLVFILPGVERTETRLHAPAVPMQSADNVSADVLLRRARVPTSTSHHEVFLDERGIFAAESVSAAEVLTTASIRTRGRLCRTGTAHALPISLWPSQPAWPRRPTPC